MKKYLLLALILFALIAAPVMADVTWSGVLRAGGIWDFGEEESTSRLDRTRFIINAGIDDYSTFVGQFRGARPKGPAETGTYNGHSSDVPVAIYDAKVVTDWGKYFALGDQLGLKTTVGYGGYGMYSNNDALDYTIYGIGGADQALGEGYTGIRFDAKIAGAANVYFATPFRKYLGAGGAQYIGGIYADVKPVYFEVYYVQNGLSDYGRQFSAEVQYTQAVAEGSDLKVGATLTGTTGVSYADDPKAFAFDYNVLVGFSAAGAQIDAAILGSTLDDGSDASYALSGIVLSADYKVNDYLGLLVGTKLAMGDYKKNAAGDEAFLGADFGIYIKPGKVKYGIGYVYLNEDALGAYGGEGPSSGPQYNSAENWFGGNTGTGGISDFGAGGLNTKGGIYFNVNAKF